MSDAVCGSEKVHFSYRSGWRRSGLGGWPVVDELVDVVVLVVAVRFASGQGHLVHLEHGHLHVQSVGRVSRDGGAAADERAARFDDMTDQLNGWM